MADEKFHVKPGEEIEIRVPLRAGARTAESQKPLLPRRGIIETRGASDILPRRLQKSGINFYDLGHLKNAETGIYEDINFHFAPSATLLEGDVRFGPYLAQDNTAKDDLYFSIPLADWKARFNRFTKQSGKKYKLVVFAGDTEYDFSDDETEWTDAGLKLSATSIAAGNTNSTGFLFYQSRPDTYNRGAFFGFSLLGTNGSKITRARDPNAPEVPFEISGNMDIFLVPGVMFSNGSSVFQRNGEETNGFLLNFLLNIYPRAMFLDESNQFFNRSVAQRTYSSSSTAPDTLENYNLAIEAVNLAKSFPNARAFSGTSAPGTIYSQISLNGFPPPEISYPPPDTTNYLVQPGVVVNYFYTEPYSVENDVLKPFLIAVIMKGSQIYYVWHKQF